MVSSKHIITTTRLILVLLGSILAGYSLVDIKPSILLKLTEFKYMFVSYFLLSMGIIGFKFSEWRKDIIMLISISLLFTTIVYLAKHKLNLSVNPLN